MTFVFSRPVADRLTLGSIAILVACAAGCQSDLADQQPSSSTNPNGQSQGKGGGASDSKSSNDQGGADGSGNTKDQGGERATSDTSDSDAGGSNSTDSERGGTGQGGASSSAGNRGGAANGGSNSVAQGATATGGRSSRTSGVGGRTQFGSSTGGRSAGGQATGGKSQAGEATGGRTQSGSATGGKAPGGGAGGASAGSSSTGGSNTGGSKASSTSASSAPNADAQAYVDATNEVRAAVTAPANYSGTWVPLPNVTWSEEVAASAQQWANHLRDAEGCGLVHEQNTGLGENLAMGTRLTPAGAVQLWAGEKSKFTYSSPFSYTAAAGHYTQLVWRTSIQIGCASATCGNSVVISCRYKPPGNVIGGKIY